MGAGSHAQVLWSTEHGPHLVSFFQSPPEPSRVCSYPPHHTFFSPSAPSSFPSIQNSGSHRSGPASVCSMAAGARGKFHGGRVAGGPGVRRSCEQIRGGRKPGGRGGGNVGGGGSTKLGARGDRIERGDDWIVVRGHRIGRGGLCINNQGHVYVPDSVIFFSLSSLTTSAGKTSRPLPPSLSLGVVCSSGDRQPPSQPRRRLGLHLC